MADSPTSVTPQSNPAISDPAMDTNQIYEHESERPQQVSPDSDIQLAQNDVYLGGRQLNNPSGAEVHSSEEEPTPPAVAHGRTFHDQDSADLAERGQPRDIGNWSNGQADEILNRPAVQRQMDAEQHAKTQAMLRTVSKDTHDIVQAPNGAKVAFPKGTPPDTMHQALTNWWNGLSDGDKQPQAPTAKEEVSNLLNGRKIEDLSMAERSQLVGIGFREFAQREMNAAMGPEAKSTSTINQLYHGVRSWGAALGGTAAEAAGGFMTKANAALLGLGILEPGVAGAVFSKQAIEGAKQAYQVAKTSPTPENIEHFLMATSMIPLAGAGMEETGNGLIGERVLRSKVVAPEPLPVSKEKTTVPTTTSYVHTPDQSGQFGNLTHAVTTKNLQGNVVGHLAAQDTAPGEVTVRSNQIYDAAHQGQGKGTSQLRTLVNETAKDPAIKTIHSDISTTGAARGAWDKLAMEHPDVVTKENIKGTPRYSVDLDKVRENAANAPEFNGAERRGSARSAPMGATDLEQAMKNPGQRIQTPFDVTEGAMDTINKDINKRLEPLEGPKPPKARAASAPTQSVGAASANDLNTKPDVPPFYSKAEQIIGEKVSNNASGDQIKNVLKNAGVKDDEMKWSGLDDYLSGKTKVSKSDLQQYIAEHKLSVQDVDLGKEQRYNLTPNEEETTHAGEPMFDVKDPQNGLTRFTGTEHAAHDYMSELGQGLTGDEHAELQQLQKTSDEIDAEHHAQGVEQVRNLREAREQHGTMSVEAKAAEDAIDNSKLSRAEEQAKVIARIGDLQKKAERGAVNRQTQYGKSEGLGGGNGDWTVPGPKRNYQEKLLTLPNSEAAVTPERKAYTDFHDSLMRKYGVNPQDFNPDVAARPEGYQARIDAAQAKITPEERQQGLELRSNANHAEADARRTAKGNGVYTAPHFQKGEKQPNIVAHMRFSDRDAVNGKKTLFLEEAQSDWHSAGRHEGYQGDAKAIDAANKRIAAAEAERTQHVQSVMDRVNDLRSKLTDQEKIDNSITGKVDHDPASRSIPYTLRDAMTTDELAKYQELQDKVSQEENVKRGLKAGGVPDAPFKQNWHELAMKRMLRHAAENGYEQMAWTTGKQQADLYGLEHHFSRLEYDPERGLLAGYDPRGHIVLQEEVDPDAKSLAEYMGPELAEKMADKIQDYHDNDPGRPDPDMFYDNVREGYDIEPREVPDEDHEFEPVQEREDFDSYVKELAEKYGFKHPEHVPWNDLSLHMTEEEKAKGESMIKDAEDAEEQQEQDRPTKTEYHVTQNGDDVSGPHDTEDDAEEAMRNHIDRDVQYEMENYEADKPETPTLSGLDLHHGGEFHKLLYDQMIPSFLKKYAKKWGAEVGTTDIKNMGEQGEPEYEGPDISSSEIEKAYQREGKYHNLSLTQTDRLRDIADYMKSKNVSFKKAVEAHKQGPVLQGLLQYFGGKMVPQGSKATVHSIPITEEMRKSVMKQGQPIAKSEQPDRKKIFGQLGSALA